MVYRGNTFSSLGMNITITEDKLIIIEMKDQLLKAVELFESWDGEEIREMVILLAQKQL